VSLFIFYVKRKSLFNWIAAKEKLEIVKSCGEAAPNFHGKNAFGLIQEYCIITSAKFSAGHARLQPSPPAGGEGGNHIFPQKADQPLAEIWGKKIF